MSATAPVGAPASRPTRQRLPRAERRAAILAAATSAFAVGGYLGTSMADIARAAGVSHLIVYRHFESKAALYEAVLARAVERLAPVCSSAGVTGPYGPTPAAMLAAARADEHAFRVLWHHAPREPEFAHHADAARAQLVAVTLAALEPMVAAEYRRWAARATVTYVVEAVRVWVEDGEPALDRRFVTATDAALRAGVRAWTRRGRAGGP